MVFIIMAVKIDGLSKNLDLSTWKTMSQASAVAKEILPSAEISVSVILDFS